MEIRFAISNHCSAFEPQSIGTRVVNKERFIALLKAAVANHDQGTDRVPGQHFVVLAPEAVDTVSCGVGRHTGSPEDYVLRVHRGKVDAYLRRELAAPAEKVAAVVYTAEAYFRDPDVTEERAEPVRASGATHVVVAVLAFAGPQAPLSPYRLVHNLAGGNREAETWSADEIRDRARASKAYHDAWGVVAD